ncbi:hypothetical protein Tco_0004130 [Tanacetum coccineum]
MVFLPAGDGDEWSSTKLDWGVVRREPGRERVTLAKPGSEEQRNEIESVGHESVGRVGWGVMWCLAREWPRMKRGQRKRCVEKENVVAHETRVAASGGVDRDERCQAVCGERCNIMEASNGQMRSNRLWQRRSVSGLRWRTAVVKIELRRYLDLNGDDFVCELIERSREAEV